MSTEPYHWFDDPAEDLRHQQDQPAPSGDQSGSTVTLTDNGDETTTVEVT